jgi:hypothetical protein
MWLGRRRLPAGKRPPLERDERVVAWAPTPAGDVVVATNRGLVLPGRAARLPWHQIHKAVWSGRELVVTPAETVERGDGYEVADDLPSEAHLLLEPRDLPKQVYARVTGSVAYTVHHPFPGGGGVRVVARRVSGVDGLTWTVRYDPGTDRDSAATRERTAELVAQARDAGEISGA